MQLAIDGCKKVFAVDVNNDIERIRNQSCMKKEKDYPKFMKWTHDVQRTKNGKERSQSDIQIDKNKIKKRIDDSIVCPMNWLQYYLDKIQGIDKSNIIETHMFLVPKPHGTAKATQMSKIRKLIEEYDAFVKLNILYCHEIDDYFIIEEKTQEVMDRISSIKMSPVTIRRLIETSLGIEKNTPSNKRYTKATKYTRKMMNILYRTNKEKFLNCFKTSV